jgi:hypothetical protein
VQEKDKDTKEEEKKKMDGQSMRRQEGDKEGEEMGKENGKMEDKK